MGSFLYCLLPPTLRIIVCATCCHPHCGSVPEHHEPSDTGAPLFSKTHYQHGSQQLSSKQCLSVCNIHRWSLIVNRAQVFCVNPLSTLCSCCIQAVGPCISHTLIIEYTCIPIRALHPVAGGRHEHLYTCDFLCCMYQFYVHWRACGCILR